MKVVLMATIRLFNNVPWSRGGYTVLRFPNKTSQTNYFNSLNPVVLDDIDYEPRRGANLNIEDLTIMDARQYGYLSWENEDYGPLYYFIEGYEYLNDNPTIRLIISEDIWQNNHLNMVVNPSHVYRRHMPGWSGSNPILYPVDEGNARSFDTTTLLDIKNTGILTFLIITNKRLDLAADVDMADGIFYYMTATKEDGTSINNTDGIRMINPLSPSFSYYWKNFHSNLSLNSIVAIYVMPYFGGASLSGSNVNFSAPGSYKTTDGIKPQMALFVPNEDMFSYAKDFNISIPKPMKGSATSITSYNYEPQAWSDNFSYIGITDQAGNMLITIPKNIAWNISSIRVNAEFKSMEPQLRISFNYDGHFGAISNGTRVVIPFTSIPVPQSNYLDYVAQSKALDKRILENSIRNNRDQVIVSTLTGAASGAAYGAMYAESFNNSRRSPITAGAAGAAMNMLGGVGSLINAELNARNQRDEFALNEQKLRNSVTPPINGSNITPVMDEGIRIIQFDADRVSREIGAMRYHTMGVIVDEVQDINLRTRYYYDFIQTKDCRISGPLNQESKDYISRLFDSGLTIFHAETFRGFRYDLNNPEV